MAPKKPAARREPPQPDAEVRRLLQDAAPRAVALLVRAMEDESAPIPLRIDAAKTVMDRIYGKPSQPLGAQREGASLTLAPELDEFAG